MAVLALVNDLMVVFGTFVLLRTALDGNFIAAMLTILGYSINDTVAVSYTHLYKMEEDKVRELVNVDDLKKDLAINKAIDFIKSHANICLLYTSRCV